MNKSSGLFDMIEPKQRFTDCLQVRYKLDVFTKYCLFILRAIGKLAADEADQNGQSGPARI